MALNTGPHSTTVASPWVDQPLTVPLTSSALTLALGGGKGAHLARLARAGLPVPDGFVITTAAYHRFVVANQIEAALQAALASGDPSDPAALEAVAAAIRDRFARGSIPQDLAEAIAEAYRALGSPAVAVRSSATAEDLPDLSFAGQHETLLNITGEEALLRAVVTCWSSLWTARAIGYRARNELEQGDLALAVIVQRLVPSEAAGVLFTANPLTGKRDEIVIDAILGLGEALVAGQVEPDHYVVDAATQRILRKQLGAKAVAIVPRAEGGTAVLPVSATTRQALPDDRIIALARLGRGIAALFGTPQDIEWAWAEGQLWILQSRPITSLFPLPVNLPPTPLQVLFSVGAVQGVREPFTPLGRDFFRHLAAAGAGYFGVRRTAATQRVVLEAGERLFVNLTGIVRHPLGRRLLRQILRVAEPATGELLETVWNDPALHPVWPRLSPRTYWRIARLLQRLIRGVVLNLLRPAHRRAQIQQHLNQAIAMYLQRQAQATTLGERVALFEETPTLIGKLILPWIVPTIASGMAALQLLSRLAASLPDGQRLVLLVTRGLPHNVTTEMDLALWQTARAIQADPAAATYFLQAAPDVLAVELHAGRLPGAAQTAIDAFLQRYGMRGVAEIDLGHPRWRDQPEPLMRVLQSYLQISDPQRAPDVVFARSAAEAATAIEQIVTGLRRTRAGWIKARLARWAARRVRELSGLRETPKFTFVRLLDAIRDGMLASGHALASAGVLDHPDDIFLLYAAELRELAQDPGRDWRALISTRRAAYQREMRRRQIPRLLLSDGRTFYEGVAPPANTNGNLLIGSPVSPGVVEGIAHVVFDPHRERLAPGEILVCHGTDPAWTPLFLTAGGLVMEVGGLMTHGSVVAREYGIPAVVGVDQATRRLRSGQRIRVDGSSGRITVLDD
ncbi:PEP/pyruvate-binding domain-containing protein [Kallotenue papyrolyticum]|uniref:PEP/pyruvate-binding domain-containing protein n=1 Tax=Kallotenue papyrolyticum TaxID=1325125 RepID=UPI00047859F1|nr:PEP/pyruvate-binding domain-containing protein [Kallotenue papyrolyticum]